MSRASRPLLLGVFVLTALLIGFALLAFVASDGLFAKLEPCVVHFEGDVNGLDVGSPVLYRGFRVGRVTDMRLIVDPESGGARLPVFLGLETDRLQFADGAESPLHDSPLARNLRAKLQAQSLITGQMAIQLVEAPETAGHVSGTEHGVPEIPTIPNLRESLTETLENMPLGGIAEDLSATLHHINTALANGSLENAVGSLNSTLKRSDRLLASLEEPIPSLVDDLRASTVELRKTLRAIRAVGEEARPLAADLRRELPGALKGWNTTMNEAGETLERLRGQIDPANPSHRKVLEAVGRIEAAARSVERLADYLQRHPESLLRGKSQPGGTP